MHAGKRTLAINMRKMSKLKCEGQSETVKTNEGQEKRGGSVVYMGDPHEAGKKNLNFHVECKSYFEEDLTASELPRMS